MKKRGIIFSLIITILTLGLCGCEARKTCPLCGHTFLGDGVAYGDYIICEDCDRDNQFLQEMMQSVQEDSSDNSVTDNASGVNE